MLKWCSSELHEVQWLLFSIKNAVALQEMVFFPFIYFWEVEALFPVHRPEAVL